MLVAKQVLTEGRPVTSHPQLFPLQPASPGHHSSASPTHDDARTGEQSHYSSFPESPSQSSTAFLRPLAYRGHKVGRALGPESSGLAPGHFLNCSGCLQELSAPDYGEDKAKGIWVSYTVPSCQAQCHRSSPFVHQRESENVLWHRTWGGETGNCLWKSQQTFSFKQTNSKKIIRWRKSQGARGLANP